MDIIHNISKFADHNRGLSVGGIVAIACVFLAGCSGFDGETVSTSSGNVVNGEELKAEYVVTSRTLTKRLAIVEAQFRELEADIDFTDQAYVDDAATIESELEARKKLLGEAASLVATTASVPWLTPLLAIGGISVGGGATYDNIRKDRVIKNKQAEAAA